MRCRVDFLLFDNRIGVSGFFSDVPDVGGVGGDVTRRMWGDYCEISTGYPTADYAGYIGPIVEPHAARGAFAAGARTRIGAAGDIKRIGYVLEVDSARIVPVGPVNSPRRWGALACVYLGRPAS